MRCSDLDYTKVESLKEFVNLLNFGDLEHVKVEDVSIQGLMIELP